MTNAIYDQNFVKTKLGVWCVDGVTTIPIAIDGATGHVKTDEVSTISIVGNMFSLIGKLLITLATVAIAYSIYKESIEYQQNIDNIGLLFFISALIGFFVGSLFINLFSTTYEAFFTCFLIQQNIQDLSPNQGGAIDSNCPEELRRTLRELRQERSGAYAQL